MDITSVFRLMQHWPELKHALALWNQIKAPFTELVDIIRNVGGDVGLLEPTEENINKLQASPLGRFDTHWVQETLTMPMPGNSTDLVADGEHGPLTQTAIKKFQTAHPPLKVDGWAGLQTLAVMEMERKKIGVAD